MGNKEHKNKLPSQEFDKKYEAILNELKGMAKGSAEERAVRFRWINTHPEYDRFIVDIINMSKNNYYDTLERRLANEVRVNIDADDGIATMEKKRKKRIDPLVLMEAIKQVIENYTGEERKEGGNAPFSALVGEIYKRKAQQAAGQNDLNKKGGFHLGTPKRDQYYILKLVKTVKQLKEKEGFLKTTEEIIEEVKTKIPHKFTKAELKVAMEMVDKLDLIRSFDQPVTRGGDNQATMQELLEDDSQYAQEEVVDAEFCRELSDHFIDKWNEVAAATTKPSREILKAFFSKDLLIALKLEALDEAMRKEYKELLEPKCGQWCHKKNRCPYSRKNGCYIRYGMREGCKQNGDDEIYDILKKIKKLYEAILDNDYVRYAYSEPIKGLQDIYEKRLKPFKGDEKVGTFLFTDVILGEALGETKSKISKQKAKYEQATRTTLFQIFQSESC